MPFPTSMTFVIKVVSTRTVLYSFCCVTNNQSNITVYMSLKKYFKGKRSTTGKSLYTLRKIIKEEMTLLQLVCILVLVRQLLLKG